MQAIDGAEDRSHPEQSHQTLAESDAAEAGERDQDKQADAKPDSGPGSICSRCGRFGQLLHGGSRVRRSYRCTPARRMRVCALRSTWSRRSVRRDADCAERADALGSTNALRIASARIGMTGLDRLIQPVRQFALARQRAIPFTVVIGERGGPAIAAAPDRSAPVLRRSRRATRSAARCGRSGDSEPPAESAGR